MGPLQNLASQITVGVIVPFLILLGMTAAFAWLLFRAQSRPDWDAAGFFRDENGKESATRMFSFVALAMTTWIMAALVFNDKMNTDYFLWYSLTWASTPVLKEIASKWNGTLPFGPKG